MKKIIYKYGGASIPTIMFGLFLLVFGLAASVVAYIDDGIEKYVEIITFIIALFGGLIAFVRRGIIIDIETKTAKVYSRIYGFRLGKWESLDGYPNISILSKQYSGTIDSRSNLQVHMGSSNYYEVHLLNKTHTKKYFIKSHDIIETAKLNMNHLAAVLDVEMVKYNPVISQKTKDRRYGKRK